MTNTKETSKRYRTRCLYCVWSSNFDKQVNCDLLVIGIRLCGYYDFISISSWTWM